MSTILYGLANPAMDEALEQEIRLANSAWDDAKVTAEMNKVKSKATFFNEKNSKKNSTKKPKEVKVKK